jgi:hypothetical protein
VQHRLVVVVVIVGLAGAALGGACAPQRETELFWTLDDEDPAPLCRALPNGAFVDITVLSRDTPDDDDDAVTVITNTAADCGKGRATITSGAFATIDVTLNDDDRILAQAAPIDLPPASTSGDAGEVVAALRTVRGHLRATLVVGGRSCVDAGASAFTVSLSAYAEPRTLAPVVTDATVACDDDGAVFEYAPVDVGTTYLVAASTTIDGRSYATRSWGEGVVVDGANTAFVVDLDAE